MTNPQIAALLQKIADEVNDARTSSELALEVFGLDRDGLDQVVGSMAISYGFGLDRQRYLMLCGFLVLGGKLAIEHMKNLGAKAAS